MDKKFKLGFGSVLALFMLGWPFLRQLVRFREEVNDTASFFLWIGNSVVSIFSDPFSWFGSMLVLLMAIVCRDDIRDLWVDRPGWLRGSPRQLKKAAGENNANDYAQRLRAAKAQITKIANQVPTPRTKAAIHEIGKIYGDMLVTMYGKEVKDWKTETAAELLGVVNDSIVNAYRGCLNEQHPELAAKSFLVSTASNLAISDLRSYASERTEQTEKSGDALAVEKYRAQQNNLEHLRELLNKHADNTPFIIPFNPHAAQVWTRQAQTMLSANVKERAAKKFTCGKEPLETQGELTVAAGILRTIAASLRVEDLLR